MATGVAIGVGLAISSYYANKSAKAQSKAINKSGDAQAQAQVYAVDAQKDMFDIARQDLSWARNLGNDAPTPKSDMANFRFSQAPALGQFEYSGQKPGEFTGIDREQPDFSFDEQAPGNFEFSFNTDDEIYKWKKAETQRLVDQKMAAMGNMRSTANLTQSNKAMMDLMSKEVEEQYGRQWQTHTQNAADFQLRLNTAMGQHNIASQDFRDAYTTALSTHNTQTADYANSFNQALTGFNANQQSTMNQFGMTQAGETSEWNRMAGLQNIDTQNYWNRINTKLSGSNASANTAQTTGAGLANTYIQGGQNQAANIMAQGNNQAMYYQGMSQLPWQAMGMYGTMTA